MAGPGDLRIGLAVHVPVGTSSAAVLPTLVDTARTAERAGLDFLVTPDGLAGAREVPDGVRQGLQGPILAMALVSATRDMLVLTALRQRLYHPLHAASALSTLATFAPGRCGVLLQPDLSPEHEDLVQPAVCDARRTAWAADHLAAVRALWHADPGEPFSYTGTAFVMSGVTAGSPVPVDLLIGLDGTGPVDVRSPDGGPCWLLVDEDPRTEGNATGAPDGAAHVREVVLALGDDDWVDRAMTQDWPAQVRLGQRTPRLVRGGAAHGAAAISELNRRGVGAVVLHVLPGEDGALDWTAIVDLLDRLGESGLRQDPRRSGWTW